MGAGCPGDNSLTDILIHGLKPFPLDMCVLVKLIGPKGVDALVSSGVKYRHWENGKDLTAGRKCLLGLIPSELDVNSIQVDYENLIKTAHKFYVVGLESKELRDRYWEISLRFYTKANKELALHGKSLEIFRKLQS